MSTIKIEVLKPLTLRNTSNGALTSYACGEIASVDDSVGNPLISAGLAKAYTLLTPTGTKTITANGTDIDVAQYAKANVNVESDFSSAEVTLIIENSASGKKGSIKFPVPNITGGTQITADQTVYINGETTPLNSVVNVVLYKGSCTLQELVLDKVTIAGLPSATGGVTIGDSNTIIVTGDGTLTLPVVATGD